MSGRGWGAQVGPGSPSAKPRGQRCLQPARLLLASPALVEPKAHQARLSSSRKSRTPSCPRTPSGGGLLLEDRVRLQAA